MFVLRNSNVKSNEYLAYKLLQGTQLDRAMELSTHVIRNPWKILPKNSKYLEMTRIRSIWTRKFKLITFPWL